MHLHFGPPTSHVRLLAPCVGRELAGRGHGSSRPCSPVVMMYAVYGRAEAERGDGGTQLGGHGGRDPAGSGSRMRVVDRDWDGVPVLVVGVWLMLLAVGVWYIRWGRGVVGCCR